MQGCRVSCERDQARIACKAFRQIQLDSTQCAECMAVIEALVQRATIGQQPEAARPVGLYPVFTHPQTPLSQLLSFVCLLVVSLFVPVVQLVCNRVCSPVVPHSFVCFP